MAEILTSKYKTDNLRLFYNSLQAGEYYVFVSSVDTEITNRTTAVNADRYAMNFLEKTLFGKKILSSDVKFMIKYYPWQNGQVFVQYDDIADLEGQKFYAVVGPNLNDTGDYRIYKCLYNNNGQAVSTPPNYSPTQEDQTYTTADGYVWKFMYELTQSDFEAYNALGYIPVGSSYGSFDIDPLANTSIEYAGSSIDQILVNNPEGNYGYPYVQGIVTDFPDISGRIQVKSDDLNEITNYYSGMTIYVTDTNGVSHLRVIQSYSYDSSNGVGNFIVTIDSENPRLDSFAKLGTAKIFPTIEILGDGSGAQAIPTVVDGKITKIVIIERGDDYNNVSVSVVDPLYNFNPESENSIEVRAELRAILSPLGGHGNNLLDEFKCRHLLLYGYITEADSNSIGQSGTYSYIGLVKNPEWSNTVLYATEGPTVFDNRLAITTDEIFSIGAVGDEVIQVNNDNEVIFKGLIHEIDYAANTVYLNSYMGAYVNAANSDISFSESYDLTNTLGGLVSINTPVADNITKSPYVQRSGEVIFMEDFIPLTRNSTSREEYKLVLEF